MLHCQRTLQEFSSPTTITEGRRGIFAEVGVEGYAAPDLNMDTNAYKVCLCGSFKIRFHEVLVYKRLLKNSTE